MTDRKPGFRWSVGVRYSKLREKVFTEEDAKQRRRGWSNGPPPEVGSIVYTLDGATPDYWFVTEAGKLDDRLGEHFVSLEEAEARAEELNVADVRATLDLDPAFEERRERLKTLDPHRSTYAHGWHREALYPVRPERYAAQVFYDDGDVSWEGYDTLEKVREVIASDRVERVVDLDTGADVPFIVTVAFEEAVAQEP